MILLSSTVLYIDRTGTLERIDKFAFRQVKYIFTLFMRNNSRLSFIDKKAFMKSYSDEKDFEQNISSASVAFLNNKNLTKFEENTCPWS